MGKITGLEEVRDIPPKVLLMYEAIEGLIVEGADINSIRVSAITERAGIGKGTAYDYFDTKEDILACAVIFFIRKAMKELNCALECFPHFIEKVDFLLEQIEKSNVQHRCVWRYIHMMTDNSTLSRLVQEKVRGKGADKYFLNEVFVKMLEEGIASEEVRKDLSVDYMVYVLFSKILSYLLCLCGEGGESTQGKKFRSFVYQSVLVELCEKKV